MSEERKADLEAAFAELEYEVWLAIKQGAPVGAYTADIECEGVTYAVIVKYDRVENL